MKKRKYIRYELMWLMGMLIFFSQTGCGKNEVVFLTEESMNLQQETVEEILAESIMDKIAEEQQVIQIYICGAVNEPGVYVLTADSRMNDAVSAAGGFTEEADVTSINLAARIADEDMIYVYTREQIEKGEYLSGPVIRTKNDGLVNINTADVEELCSLSGIGESRAKDIITYREKHGTFQKKEDLMKVSGIKESIYQKICDSISVK